MKYLDRYNISLEDRMFHIVSTENFNNNPNVNTNIIDTFENHIINFCKSKNVTYNATDNRIELTDKFKEGYFVTQDIYPHISSKSLNNFYLSSRHSFNNDRCETLSEIKYYIVTDNNEEFEINYNDIELTLLKDVKYFSIKCKLIPSKENKTPYVYGYSCSFKDKSIYDLNKTNI